MVRYLMYKLNNRHNSKEFYVVSGNIAVGYLDIEIEKAVKKLK